MNMSAEVPVSMQARSSGTETENGGKWATIWILVLEPTDFLLDSYTLVHSGWHSHHSIESILSKAPSNLFFSPKHKVIYHLLFDTTDNFYSENLSCWGFGISLLVLFSTL